MKRIIWLLYLLGGLLSIAFAQPANDNCDQAEEIVIPDNGLAFGIFTSDTVQVNSATTQVGEYFPPGAHNGKSVWYIFTLGTTREVAILLQQDGVNIPTGDAGWVLYKSGSCLPGAAEQVEPVIFQIEGYTHACLRKGTYLIQVGTENNSNGDLFLQLDIGPSTAIETDHDYGSDAYDFQIVSGNSVPAAYYEAGCQSITAGEALCADSSEYVKSSWHVFTTDNHADYLRFYIREYPFNTSLLDPRYFMFSLYEGDVRTDSLSLSMLDSCRILTQLSQNNYEYANYFCNLQPNTTYSIQVLFENDYFGGVEVAVDEAGVQPTAGPDPMNLPPSHQLGLLSSGNNYYVNDYFSCNALTSLYACGSIIEDTLVDNGNILDLNWWATFELDKLENLSISMSQAYSQPAPLIRVFAGTPTDSCTLQMLGQSYGTVNLSCLDSGTYSVQVLGQMNDPGWPNSTSNMAKSAQLRVQTANNTLTNGPDPLNLPASNEFGLLTSGNTYSIYDRFGCNAFMVDYVCGSIVQDTIWSLGTAYDMNWWTTFEISQYENVSIWTSNFYSQYSPRIRLFRATANDSCTLELVSEWSGNEYFPCLDSGVYSIQLLGRYNAGGYNSNINKGGNINLSLTASTLSNGPDPLNLPPINDLGLLTTGNSYNMGDIFGCNSFMADYVCGSIVQDTISVSGIDYDLNWWTTFELNNVENINFDLDGPNQPIVGIRLFRGTASDSCNLELIHEWIGESQQTVYCLDPGTYSIQILGRYEVGNSTNLGYFNNMSVDLWNDVSTNGPDPQNIPPSNQMGNLVGGNLYSVTDRFGCNSFMADYPCSPITEDTIWMTGTPYVMNWWTTFTLTQTENLQIWRNGSIFQTSPGIRIFKGTGADSCNLELVTQWKGNGYVNFPCLEAGTYSIQVLGHFTGNFGYNNTIYIDLEPNYVNQFGLINASDYDSINALNPLLPGNSYTSTYNYFDCNTTIMPAGDTCGNSHDRAMYRVLEIGQDGILNIYGGDWQDMQYKLFRGDASALPVVNGEIQGLVDQACCQTTYYSFKVCVTPGRYTLVTYGGPEDVNDGDQPSFHFNSFSSSFTDPNNPEVMDTLSLNNLSIGATAARFYCADNPMTLLGYAPCNGATKQIYREFYLADYASLDFDNLTAEYVNHDGQVQYRLFRGRISTGSLDSLLRDCFTSFDMSSCDLYEPGWITVVAYDRGGSFLNPEYCGNIGEAIGDINDFSITINAAYTPPQFNTFAKAEDVNNGNPVDWYPIYSAGYTPAIPVNDTVYVLGTEYFNCLDDLPFPAGITACAPSDNRISYRVFSLSNPSFVRITGLNPYPYGYEHRLYIGDITSLTPPFSVEQDCFTGELRKCLDAGTYTLVTFASDNHIARQITPSIYVDSLGTSKYDHASDAYNYGNIPLDGTEYLAAPGAPLDALGRPESNDFIFCTTSAQASDPQNVCTVGSQSLPYATNMPLNKRQNLWYTFEISGSGQIDVSVYALTPGKVSRLPFAVYRVNNNAYPLTDSTAADLTLITTSQNYWCWSHYQSVSFQRDPCSPGNTDRYVVLVDRNAYYNNSNSYLPNMQLQVGVRYTAIPGFTVKYDHYSQANVISGDPTVNCNGPYSPVSLGGGTYTGCEGFLECATKDSTDQNTCGNNTIWYKFTVDSRSVVRLNYTRTDISFTGFNSNDNVDMQLYESLVPGDSTSTGLSFINQTRVYLTGNPDFPGGYYWGESCLDSGDYYIMFTGCDFPTGKVIPRVWITPLRIYEHYSDANWITGNPSINCEGPYPDSTLLIGTYTGCEGDLICATRDSTDQNACGDNTIWYKFKIAKPSRLRLNYDRLDNGYTGYASNGYNNMQLYQSIVSGDSTSNGLIHQPLTRIYVNGNPDLPGYYYWGESCVDSGEYYIMFTGCNFSRTQVRPRIWIDTALVYNDHYSQAKTIPTDSNSCFYPADDTLLYTGTFTGCETDLSCATKDPTDQNNCGTKTVWYKFDVSGSGVVRINYSRTDNGTTSFNANDMKLYRSIIPGDSSASGLQDIPLTSVYTSSPDFPGNYWWGQSCYTEGTYYLMITGCNFPNATVLPRIWLDNYPGDFCSDSIAVQIPGPGTYVTSAVVDCWTIGESPGESNPQMACLGSPLGQKSGWFYINITSGQKLDLDVNITENTNATALQVRYRVGNGSCALMTFDNCVDDSYITLNLKCRQDSGLWIQVVMPETAIGDISLNIEANISPDQSCEPLDPFGPVANFDFEADCVEDPVCFSNQSSLGQNLSYHWDFGDGFTSTLFEPCHSYAQPDTYLVELIVTADTIADTTVRQVFVFSSPTALFSMPDTAYVGQPITITDQASNLINFSTYYWNFCQGGGCPVNLLTYTSSDPPPIQYSLPGTYQVCQTVTNGNCDSVYCRDIVIELWPYFSGGPYDGTDQDRDSCEQLAYFSGGPYDGTDRDGDSCSQLVYFSGGPYDGTDVDRDSCEDLAFFSGGPYDGTDRALDVCVDTATTPWGGGPYDGAAYDEILLDCEVATPWSGGSFDGHDDALLTVDCFPVNYYSGGPYDGTHRDGDSVCTDLAYFSGGPFDGADMDRDSCEDLVFFSGGPYDGADMDRDSCEELPFFSGGPYDGADMERQGFAATDAYSICVGDTLIMTTFAPTNWYWDAAGSQLAASNTDILQLDTLTETTILYVEDACGAAGLSPIFVHVTDTLDLDIAYSINCAGTVSTFSNQTLFSGPSLPTIGTDIVAYAPSGSTPGINQISFSSGNPGNFAYLHDGSNANNAWTNNNVLDETAWVQWQYFNPKSVDRIESWFTPNDPDRLPVQTRLYYSDGGPWKLVKIWRKEEMNAFFDSGHICESQNRYATRWKLEWDVTEFNAPALRELQVYANEPTANGNIQWDFGDMSPIQYGNNITHTFAIPDTYQVTMTLPIDCNCNNQISFPVVVDTCQVLEVLWQNLSGQYFADQGQIQLDWQVEGEFLQAELEQYQNGQWLPEHSFFPDSPTAYQYTDSIEWTLQEYLYRVRLVDLEGEFHQSNQVQFTIDLPQVQLILYPNPTNGNEVNLALQLPERAQIEVSIINMLGQQVQQVYRGEESQGVVIPFSVDRLTEGYYQVLVRVNGAQYHQTLQVLR